jgi:hypothetical protein
VTVSQDAAWHEPNTKAGFPEPGSRVEEAASDRVLLSGRETVFDQTHVGEGSVDPDTIAQLPRYDCNYKEVQRPDTSVKTGGRNVTHETSGDQGDWQTLVRDSKVRNRRITASVALLFMTRMVGKMRYNSWLRLLSAAVKCDVSILSALGVSRLSNNFQTLVLLRYHVDNICQHENRKTLTEPLNDTWHGNLHSTWHPALGQVYQHRAISSYCLLLILRPAYR